MIFRKKIIDGFTLIEIMVAISVFSVGILGVYALVPAVIFLGAENTDRFVAAQLALEGLEIVRNIRDSNWLEQINTPGNLWDESLDNCLVGCEADYTVLQNIDPALTPYGTGRYLKIDNQGFFNYSNGTSTEKFKRKITIANDANALNVSIEVEWSKKYPALVLVEKLYDWR